MVLEMQPLGSALPAQPFMAARRKKNHTVLGREQWCGWLFQIVPNFVCNFRVLNGGGLVAKSCLTLCNLVDWSPPGSSVHGILQARIPEWVAMSFSRGSSWPRDWTLVSCIAGKFFTVWATRETSSPKRDKLWFSKAWMFMKLTSQGRNRKQSFFFKKKLKKFFAKYKIINF